jgi:hypothetical protein
MVLAAPSGGSALSAQLARLPVEITPIKMTRIKTGEQNAATVVRSSVLAPVVQEQPEKVDLKQPAAPQSPLMIHPPAPPAPPGHEEQLEGNIYPEIPGGSALVLALLVDSRGLVIATRVMVPSGYPLLDLTYKLSAIGRNMGRPDPPLKEGDTVWRELRVDYGSQSVKLP